MEVPLYVRNKQLSMETIEGWRVVWQKICTMAYEQKSLAEKIITRPGKMNIDGRLYEVKSESFHTKIYSSEDIINQYFATLDYTWKEFSKQYGTSMPHVVPELREIHVPRVLFENMGVRAWFNHSFPNCRVFFWDE
jgi:hypothetical protein